MEHIKEDIERETRSGAGQIRYIIAQNAEQCAEVYVSSTLGLDKEVDTKEELKRQYIELFTEEIMKKI